MTTITPTFPQYTNLALKEGLFDQLMATVKHHLELEYDAHRLRGDNYSKVYLGSMEAVMANTTQYLLGILLIDERRDKLIADTNLVNIETDKAKFELDTLFPLQATKLQSEINLLDAQKILTDAQKLKVDKEVEFLTQKIVTELANVDGTGVTSDSIIGRQVALLLAQKLGFAGDIETKTAKLHADYAAVFQSVQEVPEDVLLNVDAQTAITLALATATTIKSA